MVKRCLTAPQSRSAVRRCFAIASAAFIIAAPQGRAAAADLLGTPVLRGSLFDGYARWDGFYAGGHAGASSMWNDFGSAPSKQVTFALRNTTLETEQAPSNWTTLPASTTNSLQYGGFVGYNWQWDEVVLGLELGYSHMASMESSATDSISRVVPTSDGFQNTVNISAQSSISLIDYATLRGRAGYAFGSFLPYAVIGAAVGRFNYFTGTIVNVSGINPTAIPPAQATYGPFTFVNADAKDNAFAAGFVFGLGMDVLLAPNMFLRGEWEYVAFAPVGGIRTTVNALRAGFGVRF